MCKISELFLQESPEFLCQSLKSSPVRGVPEHDTFVSPGDLTAITNAINLCNYFGLFHFTYEET